MAPQHFEMIESAPGNGSVSEASSPQDMVHGRAVTVRDSGKNDKAAELQKKAPNALKSPDAELKSAPSHNLGAGRTDPANGSALHGLCGKAELI